MDTPDTRLTVVELVPGRRLRDLEGRCQRLTSISRQTYTLRLRQLLSAAGTLVYDPYDLADDVSKHAPELGAATARDLVAAARAIVLEAGRYFAHEYGAEVQLVFVTRDGGVAAVDENQRLRTAYVQHEARPPREQPRAYAMAPNETQRQALTRYVQAVETWDPKAGRPILSLVGVFGYLADLDQHRNEDLWARLRGAIRDLAPRLSDEDRWYLADRELAAAYWWMEPAWWQAESAQEAA